MEKGQQAIIDKATRIIRNQFEGEGSGHDWWHIQRVLNMSKKLNKQLPEADSFIVQLTALVHDVGDHKFHNGDETQARSLIAKMLTSLQVDETIISEVIETVEGLSYRGAEVDTKLKSIEGQIVQDADRLDAIGAIGIARTFAYGGNKNREMHNPEVSAEMHKSFEAYKNSKGPTINHFYEKLLLLKDRMNTVPAKKIAQERHKYMEQYLEQFFGEWEGER